MRDPRLIVLAVAAALAAACGGHGPTEQRVARTRPTPTAAIIGEGRLVAIGGGRSLYLSCVGVGRPTVVLEAGFPGDTRTWRDVQPELGRSTRTCAYDRAGLGNSPPMHGTHDADDEIDDLHRLLHVARLPGPYVLVGHSYGGILTRLYAHAHPDQIAGMVLVDARGRDATRRQLAIWPPSEARDLRRAVFRPIKHGVDLAAGEALARRVRSLGTMPLAVVTAGRHEEWHRLVSRRTAHALDRLWTAMQDELAALSRNHVHAVAPDSDHFVQRSDGQPDVVIKAIRAVAGAARTGAALPPCRRLFNGAGVRCRA